MKAIFMQEIGGRLVELERKEVPPRGEYYRAVVTPITNVVSEGTEIVGTLIQKKERWIAYSMPNRPDGFAVFLLDGVE